MDKLRAMHLFVRLAELGSFTRLADEMNVSKSMISKEISRLEEDLGARLLHRSTRQLQLTETGLGYLYRCQDILLKMEDAESFVQHAQDRPAGKLKINAPMALGLTDLAAAFSAFMQRYPEIELDIHLSDEPLDLVEQGFDVGFRVSSRPLDSAYVGRPLAQFCYHVCAAPNYIAQHPAIHKASDLRDHNCFFYSYFQGRNVWPLDEGIEIKGTLKVNNTLFMLEAIKQGLGIGLLPNFICRPALDAGEVAEVLGTVKKPMLTLYVLYPARHFVPLKLQHCVKFLERWFAESHTNLSRLARVQNHQKP